MLIWSNIYVLKYGFIIICHTAILCVSSKIQVSETNPQLVPSCWPSQLLESADWRWKLWVSNLGRRLWVQVRRQAHGDEPSLQMLFTWRRLGHIVSTSLHYLFSVRTGGVELVSDVPVPGSSVTPCFAFNRSFVKRPASKAWWKTFSAVGRSPRFAATEMMLFIITMSGMSPPAIVVMRGLRSLILTA